MKNRIISLALAVLTLAALCAFPAYAEDDTPDPNAGFYYVKTDNGGGLNVRESINGRVVGSLPYGSKIYVDAFSTPEWALILYRYNKPDYGTDEYAAFVSTRYLTRTNPGPYNPGGSSSPSTTVTDADKVLADLNAEFRSGKLVEQRFNVYARPSRASGWVNLRWAPSTEAERIGTCLQGKKLTVLAETKNWYQVYDPETGMVGFISKKFVSTR